MNMKNPCWIRRILACATLFCLTMTSLGAQPVQASPPADENSWGLKITLNSSLSEWVCPDKEVPIRANYEIVSKLTTTTTEGVQLAPLMPLDMKIKVLINAELGEVKTEASKKGKIASYYDSGTFAVGYTRPINFSYYSPKKKGNEKIIITVEAVRISTKGKDKGQETSLYVYDKKVLPIKVKETCAWNINGSTNLNQVLGSMMAGGPWDPIAMYNIAGTIETDENGNLQGDAVVSLFTDEVWTGQGFENATCSLSGPWEGQSTAKLEADPNAWAKEDQIDLQVDLEPLPVEAGLLNCCIDGTCHTSPMPEFTIASFGLDFDPLSVEGGVTDLEFHFPAGHTPLKMQLIVTPAEAES